MVDPPLRPLAGGDPAGRGRAGDPGLAWRLQHHAWHGTGLRFGIWYKPFRGQDRLDKHEWRFDGGIAFKAIDMLKQNVPAPIAEYIRQTEQAKKK